MSTQRKYSLNHLWFYKLLFWIVMMMMMLVFYDSIVMEFPEQTNKIL